MQGRCTDKCVNSWLFCVFHCIPAAVDITKIGSRQTAYDRTFATFGDFRNSVEVTFGGNWKAGLNNIDSHFI